MTTTGKGVFFDGKTTARHDVTVEATPQHVRVLSAAGDTLAVWPYAEIEELSSPDGVLRIGRTGNPTLARLEVTDPQLAHVIDERAVTVDRTGATQRWSRAKVVFWSVAATVSLLLVAIFLVPEIATRLAPLVPYALERRVGEAVDAQVRRVLDRGRTSGEFECGGADGEKAGAAALAKLIARMEENAALPIPLRVKAVRRSEANAIALPGGYIYLFEGLIRRAESPDEVAGVLAHEIGHVANRDGMRSVLQGAGLSLLLGMLLGDFVGGGAVIIAARVILQSSYTRAVESAADVYAVGLMTRLGGDPRALGTILTRIAGSTHSGMKILLSHPTSKDRMAAIEAMAWRGPYRPLLSPGEWADLKRICGGKS